jgi:hypothetical protein
MKDESSAASAIERVIAEHPFLKGLKSKHPRLLADNAMPMHHKPGEPIFREG